MAAINFPDNPYTGQVFTSGNSTWTWDGFKWVSGLSPAAYLPLTGGTMKGSLILFEDPVAAMEASTKEYTDLHLSLSGGTLTGPLILAADPTVALGASTKEYVDATNIRYRNRIINGDMSVDQRNGGNQIAMPTAPTYIIDRWKFNNPTTVASKGGVGQLTLGTPPAAPVGFPYLYSFNVSVTTTYVPAAADRVSVFQAIEAINFLDAQWGTANALPVTLEFWASAAVAGTYSVSVQNYAATRSYVSTFTLAAATWTKIRINIPPDTAGTWAVSPTAPMLVLFFPLSVGSTYQTSSPNTWLAGNLQSATGSVNVFGALSSAALSITGVALMVGAAAANAEPEFRKYSDNLIDCQRYFQIVTANHRVLATGVSTWSTGMMWPTPMRAAPTAVTAGPASAGTPQLLNVQSVSLTAVASSGSFNFVSSSAGDAYALTVPYNLDADF